MRLELGKTIIQNCLATFLCFRRAARQIPFVLPTLSSPLPSQVSARQFQIVLPRLTCLVYISCKTFEQDNLDCLAQTHLLQLVYTYIYIHLRFRFSSLLLKLAVVLVFKLKACFVTLKSLILSQIPAGFSSDFRFFRLSLLGVSRNRLLWLCVDRLLCDCLGYCYFTPTMRKIVEGGVEYNLLQI